MRIVHAALLLAISGSPSLAQRVPSIVIPGRSDVPVVINGVEASWSVVEGDYGLDTPIGMTATVIYRPLAILAPYYHPGLSGFGVRVYGPRYFPSSGERPGYGRLELVPPRDRPLPRPAESFRQGWSSQSSPGPVTEYPPFAAPPIIWNGGPGGWRGQRPGGRPNGPPPNTPPPNVLPPNGQPQGLPQ